MSVDSAGNQGDADSGFTLFPPSVSADGRYVAFSSGATNLVPTDTNENFDVFVHDRETGSTERVSVDSAGTQANSYSINPSLSADGRYVAFDSVATNLVTEDDNGKSDVFVHDRQTGATQRVSVDVSGTQGDDGSFQPAISADGRYVAFGSSATNLVPSDTNVSNDVFIHDRQAGTTQRVSVDSAGNQGGDASAVPAISADGRFVVFHSFASNLVPDDDILVDVFIHDTQTGSTDLVSAASPNNQGNGGVSANPAVSGDGRFVAFDADAADLVPEDTNGKSDVFVRDLQAGTTERVSVDSSGNQANGVSINATISADGRYVAFQSFADNFVPGDTTLLDVFVHDRQTGVTELVSVGIADTQADGASDNASISGDGRYVAFQSGATNLVAEDTNGALDVFVRDRDATATTPTPTPPPLETTLSGSTAVGATTLQLTDVAGFAARDLIVINPGGASEEYSVVSSLGSLDLQAPLQFAHISGEAINRVASGIPPGDANCSRTVDILDVLSILKRTGAIGLADHCVAAGNIECQSPIDARDALAVLLYLAGTPLNIPDCPQVQP
ncbi:MAG: calcium-binding protein [Dehalococcoidia bacterium]